MRQSTIILFVCAFAAVGPAFGQVLPGTAPPGNVVIGSGSFSPIVADLDKSLEFYRSLLGIAPPPAAGPTAFGADKELLNFLGTPTAQVRFNSLRIPGTLTNVEIVDFKDINRKAVQPRMQDPGAVTLILLVRDIDTLFNKLKKEGVPVVTAGGAPVVIGGNTDKTRAVAIKDPDGFHITLVQMDPLPETSASSTSNVIGARFGLAVADMDQTLSIYRDLFGFQPETLEVISEEPLNKLWNTPGAKVRHSTMHVPGSALLVEFLEFGNIERKPINARIQDPGATRLQLRVRDSDATVKALKSAGGNVVTVGGNGGPINMRGLRVAIVREPNNLFLVIMTQTGQR